MGSALGSCDGGQNIVSELPSEVTTWAILTNEELVVDAATQLQTALPHDLSVVA